MILHLWTGYGIKHDTVTVFHWVVFANKFSLEAPNPRRDTRVSRVLFQVCHLLSSTDIQHRQAKTARNGATSYKIDYVTQVQGF